MRPEALRRFEQMVEEVSRNASAVAQNTAAAKNQPAMPVHPASEAVTHATDAAASAVPPARQPDRPRRRLSQRLPAQERHQQRPVKHRKVLLLRSPQKARQLPVPLRRKRQKRMRQRHNNQQPLLPSAATTKASEAATSARGCGGLQRGSEIIRNERIIKRQ